MIIQKTCWLRVSLSCVAMLCMGLCTYAASPSAKEEVLPSLSTRYAPTAEASETPSFQRHISPLLGRLGCNGRACHGSFQGRGGFQLSLFGYDFQADYKAMLAESEERVLPDDFANSLILSKPTDEDLHEGGKRYDKEGWQYQVLKKWIQAGASYDGKTEKLRKLQITPSEIVFQNDDRPVALKAIAHWEDGTSEDVTEICRFHTNDEAIAEIDETGLVEIKGRGDTHVVVSYDNAVVPVPVMRPVSAQSATVKREAPRTEIDRLIQVKHDKLGIVPSEICDDAEFLRRVSLDIAGTLPTATEVDLFLNDSSPDKRSKVIDQLLDSSGYAAWWATRFCDWTGNSRDKLNNVSPVRNAPPEHWYEWIHKRLQDNTPYDQMVEGIVVAKSRFDDESYEDYCKAMGEASQNASYGKFAERPGLTYFWTRNNFRTTEDRAIGFAYTFLGVRIQCAQCHKHPFDQWSKQDFDEFKNLFQTVALSQKPRDKEDLRQYEAMMAKFDTEGLRGNQLRQMLAKQLSKGEVIPFPELTERPIRGNTKVVRKKGKKPERVASVPKAKLLGGQYVQLNDMAREKLMGWLRDPENPYFAKAIVNRVWANYFGVGIVDPVDDLNLANPPSNQALMDYLAEGFIANQYDLKWLHREITDSDAYQRSWKTNETNQLDKKNFSHFLPRRMAAEVLYDALQIATANDAKSIQLCSSRDGRALAVASASARANSRNPAEYAMRVFGRSIRESNCDCDRSEEPNLLQTVYLQNDEDVLARLYDRNGWLSEEMKELGQPMPESMAVSSDAQRRKQAMEKRLSEGRKVQRAQLEKRKQQIEETIATLQGNKNLTKQQLKTRLAPYRKSLVSIENRLASLGKTRRNEPRSVSDQELASVIREAYLRTVSRNPSDEELNTSQSFIRESNTVAEGVGGLMWALVNTKEFLLVH